LSVLSSTSLSLVSVTLDLMAFEGVILPWNLIFLLH
jgi:hypothetical protein